MHCDATEAAETVSVGKGLCGHSVQVYSTRGLPRQQGPAQDRAQE